MKQGIQSWLKQHHYALLSTLRRFQRQPVATLTNVLVVALALALPLGGHTLLNNLQPLTHELTTEPELSVFMQPEATSAEASTVRTQLEAASGVTSVKFIGRETALEDMKNQPSLRDALALLPNNPLPDAFVVYVKAPPIEGLNHHGRSTDASQTLETLAAQFRLLPKVDHVQIDSAWVKRLDALLRLLYRGVIVLALALGLAIVCVLFNTTRLQVLSQRDEIEISKLFGATSSFIRRPFLYQGALQGFLGGLAACLLVLLVLQPLNQSLNLLAQLVQTQMQLRLLPALALFGWLAAATGLGWLGALLSVNRHLSRIRE